MPAWHALTAGRPSCVQQNRRRSLKTQHACRPRRRPFVLHTALKDMLAMMLFCCRRLPVRLQRQETPPNKQLICFEKPNPFKKK
jgi:hypothetical protein